MGLEGVWVRRRFSVGCVLGTSIYFRIGIVVPRCWEGVGPTSGRGGRHVVLWCRRIDRGVVLGDPGCRFKVRGAPASSSAGFNRIGRAVVPFVPFGGGQFVQHCFHVGEGMLRISEL